MARNQRHRDDRPAVQPPAGPGGNAPYGGSLYESGGPEEDYDRSPGPGDWDARTTGYDATTPGSYGDTYMHGDSWGEAEHRRERTEGTRGERFAGRGPKGWRRSDDRIGEEVCELLTRHPDIDPSDVEITVDDGEVTLSGEIEDRRMRRMAEDVAASVAGVHDVHNRLTARSGARV